MKNFFRATLKWFNSDSAAVAIEEPVVTLVEPTLEPATLESPVAPVEVLLPETTAEIASTFEIEDIEASIPAVHDRTPEAPITEAPILLEPGRPVTIIIRGARHYTNCPHCDASWSLRDRLFDPRTGRALPPHAFPCPNCRQNVSVPADLDIRSIR